MHEKYVVRPHEPLKYERGRKLSGDTNGVKVETDIQQLSGENAEDVTSRVVDILSSPVINDVMTKIFTEKNLTAPGEIILDEESVKLLAEKIIIPVIVDPWAWMGRSFKRVSKTLEAVDIGLGFGIIVACGSVISLLLLFVLFKIWQRGLPVSKEKNKRKEREEKSEHK